MVKTIETLNSKKTNNNLSIDKLFEGHLRIRDIVNETVNLFKSRQIASPRLDVELLLSKAINCKLIDIYINQNLELDDYTKRFFIGLVKKRLKHIPVQYILGNTEFMSLDFNVNKNVLIPRPETELIVESVLEIANNNRLNNCFSSTTTHEKSNNLQSQNGLNYDLDSGDESIKIIDLCTGSGNIAVSLAVMLKNAKIYASDISIGALNVAVENAKKHKVEDKTIFFHGDIFDAFKIKCVDLKADFIVSNPPYVAECDFESLQEEIVKHEPYKALISGNDGYYFYKKIIKEAKNWLNKGGYLILEIGENQLEGVIKIIKNYSNNCFQYLKSLKDLQGIDRVVIAKYI